MNERDNVYGRPQPQIVDFAFDESVVAVFPDMIRRSVPGYETMVPMTGLIAARHLGDDGLAYDLGCSLGATTLAILANTDAPDVRVVGVDSAAPMIEGARAAISDPRASFVHAPLQEVDVTDARVVILNLVLQFLEPGSRLGALTNIREQMAPDGLLLVSEKVRSDNAELHDLFDGHHLAWKRANGYSDIEVSQKRTALENVMKIDSEEAHHERFASAGFTRVVQWYRCLNWASFIVSND